MSKHPMTRSNINDGGYNNAHLFTMNATEKKDNFAAFWYDSSSSWEDKMSSIDMNWEGTDSNGKPLPEGTKVNVTLKATTSDSTEPAACSALSTFVRARRAWAAGSPGSTIRPVTSTPFWPPTRTHTAPGGTTAT